MKKSSNTPWDKYLNVPIKRFDRVHQQMVDLEPGIKFFVLALESLRCITEFSCEGHPHGFYIVFYAPYRTALKVKGPGFFSVQIEGTNRWSLRLREIGHTGPWNDRDRKQTLRWAAEAWQTKLLGKPLEIVSESGNSHIILKGKKIIVEPETSFPIPR